MNAELDVRSTSLDADLANYPDRGIAHALVFAISQRLCWCNSDRIAGVNAHRIEVLNRADDDDVVPQVTHHLEFVLFPTEHRLFDQDLMNRRKIQTACKDFKQLFAVVGNAAARTTESERRADNDWKSNFSRELEPIAQIVDESGFRNVEADARHRIFEQQPVFRHLDRAQLRADQFHSVLVQNTGIGKRHRKIERSLSTDSRQQSELPAGRSLEFNANDFFQVLARQRFNIGPICKLGISHDGRWIRVRQHNFVALRLQRLASLCA